jgi:hypothetical protein
MKVIDLNTTYTTGTKDIKLTVTIGDAQIGQSVALLDDVELGRGDIDGLLVGNGPAVKGKKLIIKTLVTDVNPRTNDMSVTYELSGGKIDHDFESVGKVDNEGESMVFRATFSLI